MSGRRLAAPLTAFVLHRYDWSESSLILELFTREMGRVAVAAKGAKRPYSQLRSLLLPFQRVHVSLTRPADAPGSGDVQNLRSAEFAGGGAMFAPQRLFSGFYINELLLKFLARHDVHERLFDAYADSLDALAQASDRDAQTALRAFELLLLRETGLLPDLHVESTTQRALSADQPYALRGESGLVGAQHDEPALPGRSWLALGEAMGNEKSDVLRRACGGHRGALKAQLRAVLHYHLGHPTLRTRDVMRGLQGLVSDPL